MSDRIEQAAQILRTHRIECTGVGEWSEVTEAVAA